MLKSKLRTNQFLRIKAKQKKKLGILFTERTYQKETPYMSSIKV